MFHLKDPFSGLGGASIVFVIPRQVATCKAVVIPVVNCTAVYSGTHFLRIRSAKFDVLRDLLK